MGRSGACASSASVSPLPAPSRLAFSFLLVTGSHRAVFATCFIPCHQPNSPILLIYGPFR